MAAGNIPVDPIWTDVDIQQICRLWDADQSGTEYRQRNYAMALRAVARAINHLAAYNTCRVVFSQMCTFEEREVSNQDLTPILRWRYNDACRNARAQMWSMHSAPPNDEPAGDHYYERQGDTSTQTSKSQGYGEGSPVFPQHLTYARMFYNRGDRDNAVRNEGLSRYYYIAPLDVLVQDVPLLSLPIDDDYDYAICNAAAGLPVVANYLEKMRSTLHELLTNNRQIAMSWSGFGDGTATPASSNSAALVVTSTASSVNVLDGSSTAWSASTPGFQPHVYLEGRGPEATTEGAKVAIQCSVYGKTTGPNATVTFDAGGTAQTAVITSSGAWVDAADVIYLDSAQDITVTSSSRNKIDIRCQLASPGTAYIYALRGWSVYY